MANERFLQDQKPNFQALFTLAGVPVTDADGKIIIRRIDDNLFFDGVSAYQAAPVSIQMIKAGGDVNNPGWWGYTPPVSLEPGTYVPTATDANSNSDSGDVFGEVIIDDDFAKSVEFAADGAIGQADYDGTGSIIKLYSWRRIAEFISFACKDKDGLAAQLKAIFNKTKI